MKYAKIKDGVVVNLMEITHNAAEFPGCIPVDDRPVQIGDTYTGGAFYRAGLRVKGPYELLAEAEAENRAVFSELRGE